MAIGRRCALGCESWPDQALYSTCPLCGEKTRRSHGLKPLSVDDANSILLHIQFERYYERRCRERQDPLETCSQS